MRWYLRLQGYHIIARRYKTYAGEIDLVAARRNTLIILEIKARRNRGDIEVLSSHQQARITRAAEAFLQRHPKYSGFNIRFDLIAYYPPLLFRHVKDAWRA